MLKLLFSIFYTYDKVSKGPTIDMVIEYLVQSCQLAYSSSSHHELGHLESYSANLSTI